MNLKCLLYARYSSSIPINIITKDTSNKELKADLDRVLLALPRCPPKSRHSSPNQANAINWEPHMEYGSSLMIKTISAMPSARPIPTPKDTPSPWFKNYGKKSEKSRMRSTRPKTTSSPTPRRWQTNWWTSTATSARWTRWQRCSKRSKAWRTKSAQASRRSWATKNPSTPWTTKPKKWRVIHP